MKLENLNLFLLFYIFVVYQMYWLLRRKMCLSFIMVTNEFCLFDCFSRFWLKSSNSDQVSALLLIHEELTLESTGGLTGSYDKLDGCLEISHVLKLWIKNVIKKVLVWVWNVSFFVLEPLDGVIHGCLWKSTTKNCFKNARFHQFIHIIQERIH